MIGGQNCISSCNGPFPCALCTCPKNELSRILLVHPKRTREDIQLLAHVVIGRCPGCDMKIVEEVKNCLLEVKILKRGDPEPIVPIGKRGKGVTHLSLHFGIVPGQTVNFDLQPEDWAICLLHANLCITGGLLNKTLLANLELHVDPAGSTGLGDQVGASAVGGQIGGGAHGWRGREGGWGCCRVDANIPAD